MKEISSNHHLLDMKNEIPKKIQKGSAFTFDRQKKNKDFHINKNYIYINKCIGVVIQESYN